MGLFYILVWLLYLGIHCCVVFILDWSLFLDNCDGLYFQTGLYVGVTMPLKWVCF